MCQGRIKFNYSQETVEEIFKKCKYVDFGARKIEKIINEPDDYSVKNMQYVIGQLDIGIAAFINEKTKLTKEEILESRYERFRRM